MRVRPYLVLAVLCVSPALAADPIEIAFEDVRLEDAAKMVAEQSGVAITVDEDIRDWKVTLKLGAPVGDVLAALAKAANARLETTEDGQYAIRDAADEEEPAWRRRLDAAMHKKKFTVPSSDLPLAQYVAEVARKSGVPIHLDPGVGNPRAGLGLEIRVTTDGKVDAARALTLLFFSRGVTWDYRWGVVFVSTGKRVDALPDTLLAPAAEDAPEWETALREKLATQTVTYRGRKTTVSGAAKAIGSRGKVKVEVDPEVAKQGRDRTLSFDVKRLTVEHALSLLLIPRGLTAEPKDGGLLVRRRTRADLHR